ncbi:MAG: tetratricopeptide repeat protein [Spirochaetaceae bacterium]|nr:tetratricopeptide repeat protein [Spirochaetaceae bacterium]
MNKRNLIFVCIFICCIVLSYFVLGRKNSARQKIKNLEALEAGVENPLTVEELEEAIAKNEARAEELLSLQEQTGNWYKILAVKYIDGEMYGEALSALQKAVQYYPQNQNLFYYIGVSAGFMAKATLDFNADGKTTERDNYLLLAESGYKRAVELEPDYFKAIYGLAVLYVLEMNQPAKAVPLLEKALKIEEKNTEAMMLLGHAYYMTYDYEAAVAMYDKVIAAGTSKERKEAAAANKKAVLDAMYE